MLFGKGSRADERVSSNTNSFSTSQSTRQLVGSLCYTVGRPPPGPNTEKDTLTFRLRFCILKGEI